MMSLENNLKELSINDLYRIWNSNKDYIVINTSVCNAGASYKVICTNDFNRYQNISNDGYSFILENDFYINEVIEKILLKKINDISLAWTKYCYDYESFNEFLKQYGISEYKYKQLLDLESNSLIDIKG